MLILSFFSLRFEIILYFCKLKIGKLIIMSSQNNLLKAILKSEKTVFTTQSLAILGGMSDTSRISSQMHYYVKQGELHNPRRGIYTKTLSTN